MLTVLVTAFSTLVAAPAASARVLMNGFALQNGVQSNLPAFNIQLAYGDSRLSRYIPYIDAAARAINNTGTASLSLHTGGIAPRDPNKGEIIIQLADSAECRDAHTGPGESLACTSIVPSGTQVIGAQIQVQTALASRSSSIYTSTFTHELLHALGLDHYEFTWGGGVQLMHPNASIGASTIQSGDLAGLWYLAEHRPPPNAAPIGSFEAATRVNATTVRLSGWALDPDTTAPIAVRVSVDGVSRNVTASTSRPDVQAAHGKGAAHGFTINQTVTSGPHQICVDALDAQGGPNTSLGCRTVTANNVPIGSLDLVSKASATSVRVAGWALDPDTTASIRVHLYVDGSFAKDVTASLTRNDIQTAYRKGAAHGFDTTVTVTPGAHSVCLWGIDADGVSNPKIACRDVVTNIQPFGSVDSAAGTGGNSITVAGWAIDRDTPSSALGIHVYVDGKYAGNGTANATRQDVHNAYQLGANHGFNFSVPATPGAHQVCVFAIDANGGNNPQLGCRDITVANQVPIGSFDMLTAGTGTMTVAGWAIDPDTTAPIKVHVYVDGVYSLQGTADVSRPDVGAAYGKGSLHGYSLSLNATAGAHSVCVYALDSAHQANNRQLSCRTVTVR
ncbi:hypothetical protein [Cellulomonas sp. NPDC089187]|uniref:hypothetical protein n=1 Tax=Cellulomonas sp. NPDC089187 TaxID=3154970 RepID=UPI003440B2B6